MSSSSRDLPRLERLLRDVTRQALERANGADWLDNLSGTVQKAIRKVGEKAKEKRPGETLRDEFDAAGLPELASLLRSNDGKLIVDAVWESREAAQVDLARLIDYRDKNLHSVGPPSGEIVDAEVAAIVKRLRVGLEGYRRNLMNDARDWWPYVETVTSNVDEFCRDRPRRERLTATLNEGDLVSLDVVGINPNGPDEDLHYCIRFGGSPGDRPEDTGWREDGRFEFVVSRVRKLMADVHIKTTEDDHGEHVGFNIMVRPGR